jgi:hypothetical protein
VPRLPAIDAAVIDGSKLTGYLLSRAHPQGAAKARFLEAFGFRRDCPDVLRAALVDHARDHDIASVHETPFGTKYEIDGHLVAPDGRRPVVRAIWFVAAGETTPRLVTLVPRRIERE